MSELIVNFLEDTVMFSACFLKAIGSLAMVVFVTSYIVYADVLFSGLFITLVSLFLVISYEFYLRNINVSKDVLTSALEKKGRKELDIEDSAESIIIAKKTSTCSLFDYPRTGAVNAKEFTITILYLGNEHLTFYYNCPKSNIYKIYKKKAKGKWKANPIEACGDSEEYYYSYIQSAHFEKGIALTLNNGKVVTIEAGKPAAKKIINKIRKRLRKTEQAWVSHAEGSHARASHSSNSG